MRRKRTGEAFDAAIESGSRGSAVGPGASEVSMPGAVGRSRAAAASREACAAHARDRAGSGHAAGRSGRIIHCAVIAALLGIFVLSGCVIVGGNFKYKGTRVEVETVDLEGLEVIEFRLGSEDLIITTENVGKADFSIEKTYRANERKYGEKLLDEAEILFRRRGDRLVIERKKEKDMGLTRLSKGYVSIDIEVALPAAMELDVHTGSGDVEIADREERVTIDTGSGDVEMGVAAAGLEVKTGSGDMTIESGRHVVKLGAGSGDIRVGGLSGTADISTGSGDVTVRKIAGDMEVSTGSGDVEINNSMGKIDASTGSGDVDIPHHAGGAELNTSSGDVMLGVDGGDGDITIKTSSGEVDIVFYGGDAYEVDVHTGSGSISGQIPLIVKDASRRRLSGSYGRGGFTVKVSTSSGGVSLTRGAI